MQAMIDELAKQAEESLGQVSSKETLATFWQEYLSKTARSRADEESALRRAGRAPAMGKIINELKTKAGRLRCCRRQGEGSRAGRPQRCRDRGHHPARQDPGAVGGLHPLTRWSPTRSSTSSRACRFAAGPEIEN